MPTQSVVFIITFTLAIAGVIFAVVKLSAKSRSDDGVSDAALKAYARQQNTPEAREQAADGAIVYVKAEALSAIEADEAAGRMPRMTGSWVATHRRNVRREISRRQARIEKRTVK